MTYFKLPFVACLLTLFVQFSALAAEKLNTSVAMIEFLATKMFSDYMGLASTATPDKRIWILEQYTQAVFIVWYGLNYKINQGKIALQYLAPLWRTLRKYNQLHLTNDPMGISKMSKDELKTAIKNAYFDKFIGEVVDDFQDERVYTNAVNEFKKSLTAQSRKTFSD